MVEEKPQYISLQEATKYCDYSQEYLSLRIRQGKLRGKKFARNWVTKKEWLEEYLKEVREYNCNSVKNGFRCQHRENFIKQQKSESIVQDGLILAQEFIKEKKPPEFKFPLKEFSRLAFVASFLFIFFASFFSPSIFEKRQFSYENTTMSAGSIWQSSFEVFSDYARWLKKNINEQIARAKTYFAEIIDQGKKSLAEKSSEKSPVREGVVVVQSTSNDEALKEKIRDSFSDEVKVELKDDGSGIITPIFKEREGDQYLYIMVPVKN